MTASPASLRARGEVGGATLARSRVALAAVVVAACAPCPACPPPAAAAPPVAIGLPCIAAIGGSSDDEAALTLSTFVAVAGQRDEVDLAVGDVRCTFASTRDGDEGGELRIDCDAPDGRANAAEPLGLREVSVSSGGRHARLRCALDAVVDIRGAGAR